MPTRESSMQPREGPQMVASAAECAPISNCLACCGSSPSLSLFCSSHLECPILEHRLFRPAGGERGGGEYERGDPGDQVIEWNQQSSGRFDHARPVKLPFNCAQLRTHAPRGMAFFGCAFANTVPQVSWTIKVAAEVSATAILLSVKATTKGAHMHAAHHR